MDKYKLCVRGRNPDYFLKKVVDRKIFIYDVKKGNKDLIIEVDDDGYKQIKKIKTSYDIEVIGVSGMVKIKELFYKYFFFILFFCMGIFINVFLSKIIFEIEVVHSNSQIREIVYKDLKEFGIRRFTFKVSFSDKEKIVRKILDKEKEHIEWLEIEEVGCKYIVKVEQRILNENESFCGSRNIVAKKDALILEIEAESGEVKRKKNDYVLKNDVIISGLIYNKDVIVASKCSVGKVFGEVWYKVNVELPTKYNESIQTGNTNYRISINFLDKKIMLFGGYDTYKEESIFLIKNRLLPVSIGFSKYYESYEKEISYSLNNCDLEAIKIAEEKILLKLGKDDEVLSKKVLKKQIKNSKILVEVFFKVKEDITAYADIGAVNEKQGGD